MSLQVTVGGPLLSEEGSPMTTWSGFLLNSCPELILVVLSPPLLLAHPSPLVAAIPAVPGGGFTGQILSMIRDDETDFMDRRFARN